MKPYGSCPYLPIAELISGTTSRLQAVSAVGPQVAWVSGVDGSYAVTRDGGRTGDLDVDRPVLEDIDGGRQLGHGRVSDPRSRGGMRARGRRIAARMIHGRRKHERDGQRERIGKRLGVTDSRVALFDGLVCAPEKHQRPRVELPGARAGIVPAVCGRQDGVARRVVRVQPHPGMSFGCLELAA